MHKRTLYSACTKYDCVRCACANSRTRHTKTRLEATLPFRTLEMQLQFSLHAGLFTGGGMPPSAKAHAYARPILMLRTTCTCTYARAAQCTPTRAVGHIIPANEPRRRSTAWLQPPHASIQWPKLRCSAATADCALHARSTDAMT